MFVNLAFAGKTFYFRSPACHGWIFVCTEFTIGTQNRTMSSCPVFNLLTKAVSDEDEGELYLVKKAEVYCVEKRQFVVSNLVGMSPVHRRVTN